MKFLLLIFSFFLLSCGAEPTYIKQGLRPVGVKHNPTDDNGYEIITIDSCEYIYAWFGQGNGGGSLTHKGNCKYCKNRN